MFPRARSPEGAVAGLYLYFSCLEEAHTDRAGSEHAEGSFWHGIVHRQEPDAANAAYWFRQVGKHPIFPALREKRSPSRLRLPATLHCHGIRSRSSIIANPPEHSPGSDEERLAMQVQLVEWQLLFDYCATGENALKQVKAAVLEAFEKPLRDPGVSGSG